MIVILVMLPINQKSVYYRICNSTKFDFFTRIRVSVAFNLQCNHRGGDRVEEASLDSVHQAFSMILLGNQFFFPWAYTKFLKCIRGENICGPDNLSNLLRSHKIVYLIVLIHTDVRIQIVL